MMSKGPQKKWDAVAERDLTIAVMMSNFETKPRFNWPKIHGMMARMGYQFSKDSLSQHFTKTILKDFKKRNGEDVLLPNVEAAKPRAQAKGKAKRKAKDETESDDDDKSAKKRGRAKNEDDEEELDFEFHRAKKQSSGTDKSATDRAFEDWLAM